MGEPAVVAVQITYAQGFLDLDFLDGSAHARLEMSDGSQESFSWYHDEISYGPADFRGKTLAEIRAMHRERDLAYLRS